MHSISRTSVISIAKFDDVSRRRRLWNNEHLARGFREIRSSLFTPSFPCYGYSLVIYYITIFDDELHAIDRSVENYA